MTQTTVGNPAVEADVTAIMKLWRQIADDEPSVDTETSRMIMEGLGYHVVRSNGQIVGAVSVMDCTRGLAKLDSLAVYPEHRGRGYGTKLASAAIKYAFANGSQSVLTLALPAAQSIFKSLGFKDIEVYDSGNALMVLDKPKR